MPHRFVRHAAVLTWFAALLAALPGPARADVDCGLDRIRLGFRQLVDANSVQSESVAYRRIDSSGPKAVGKDQSLFAAEFSRQFHASSLRVPTDFSFRSGWVLNTQFEFQKNQALRIQARYDLPGGETLYAWEAPGKPHLTLFARGDGVLCNKVMNSNAGDHVFLIKTYQSSPATKLEMVHAEQGESPLLLRIVFLGSSGGIASFRSIWSRQGHVLQSEDHRYDPDADLLQIASVELPIEQMTSDQVVVGEVAVSGDVAWGAYWSRLFGKAE